MERRRLEGQDRELDDKMGPCASLGSREQPRDAGYVLTTAPSWQHVSGEKGEEPEVESKDFSKEKQKEEYEQPLGQ